MDIMKYDLEETITLLEKYSNARGISGYEDEVRGMIIDDLRDVADRVWRDSLGNIIAVKRGFSGHKFMVAAHMDEIGLLVRHIDKEGFLYFSPVGGWNDRILPAMRVSVRTRDGRWIPGVVGVKPPHLMSEEERKKVIEHKELYIDIGVSSREEALSLGVENGSPIVPEARFTRLAGYRVTGKAFDDRAGLVAGLIAFIEAEAEAIDFYFVVTVQEEVGLKGARTSAFSVKPDVALAIDVTTANDVPKVEEQDRVAILGKGPAIKIMDGRMGSGLIANKQVVDLLRLAAEEKKIPYQMEVLPGGTTDASIIQLSREGVPSGAISIPTRYIHSPVEVLDVRDLHNTALILEAFYNKLTPEWIEDVRESIIK